MLVTIALALIVIPGQMRADPVTPHVVAIAQARAQILSSVRVGPAPQPENSKRDTRDKQAPRPRERPCPEQEATPCRLLVIDME